MKRRKKKRVRFAILPHGCSILTLFSCCPLLLDLILYSSRVKTNIRLAENVNENTFSTRAFLCVVSSSASACVLSSLTLVSCSFMLYVFTGLFFAHVCLYAPFPLPHHHVLCPFLSFRTLCAFLCLFSLFAGTVCWGWAVLSVHPVWLVSGTTLNLMI